MAEAIFYGTAMSTEKLQRPVCGEIQDWSAEIVVAESALTLVRLHERKCVVVVGTKFDLIEVALTKCASYFCLSGYSGAHEDTVCDVSSGASAVELNAEDHGPEVWISNGKHASYLSHHQCSGGCGGDPLREYGSACTPQSGQYR